MPVIPLRNGRSRKTFIIRSCNNQIADTLRENELWEDLYTLYTTAVSIEPYEEWQLGQLDALIALGQYEKAYQVYEKIAHDYTEVSDQPLSEEMMKRFRKISQYLKGGYEDLDDIQLSSDRSDQKKQGTGI